MIRPAVSTGNFHVELKCTSGGTDPMRKSVSLLFAICLFVLAAFEARAQAPSGPPKVLLIFREEIKAGRGAAPETVETAYGRAAQKAKWPSYYFGMMPVFGGTDAWFLTAYDSFAALQKDRDNAKKKMQIGAMDGEFRTGRRAVLCVLNEELSYGAALDISHMRYFSVTTVRVRPGHDQEYREARKIIVDALKKANSDAHSAFYAVTAGMPSGTFLLLTPLKSLAELDPNPAVAKDFQDALGEENTKKRTKLLADSVISTETDIYSFIPKMSYVPKEWAKMGGEYWTPRGGVQYWEAKPPRRGAKKAATREKKDGLSREAAEILDSEIEKLAQGQIVFNPAEEMQVEKDEIVEVRISRSFPADLDSGLHGRGNVQQEILKVSAYMGVTLKGTESYFSISLKNGDEKKIISKDEYTTWIYDVRPLKSGRPTLYLTAYVVLDTPKGERRYDRPIFTKEINVKTTPAKATETFIRKHWDKILELLLASGIVGWLIRRFIKWRESRKESKPWETPT